MANISTPPEKRNAIAQLSSKSTEHYTPEHVIQVARDVMGGIELDPASCAIANDRIVKADRFFSKDDDGLSKPWHASSVFLNPPGGKLPHNRSSAQVWLFNLIDEWRLGHTDQAIFFGFTLEVLRLSQTDADLRPSALRFPFCILRERTDFLCEKDGELVSQGSPTHANVLVYFPRGRNAGGLRQDLDWEISVSAFVKHASRLGDVIVPMSAASRSASYWSAGPR